MKALTHIFLPHTEVRKRPGDEVTEDELKAAKQSDEDVQRLIEAGALGEDDDDLHPDHRPVTVTVMTGTAAVDEDVDVDDNVFVEDNDEAKGDV